MTPILKFLLFRVVMGEDVDNETIEASTIRIYPDLTSK